MVPVPQLSGNDTSPIRSRKLGTVGPAGGVNRPAPPAFRRAPHGEIVIGEGN